MCWQFAPMIISGASTLLSAGMERQAGQEAVNAQLMSSMFNAMQHRQAASMYERQAVDAVERGEDERQKYMQRAGLELGAQIAQAGASGIDVGSGSTLDIIAESAASAMHDGNLIRYNAGLEAQSYRDRAEAARTQTYLELAAGQDANRAWKVKQQESGLRTLSGVADAASGIASGLYDEYQDSKAKKNANKKKGFRL